MGVGGSEPGGRRIVNVFAHDTRSNVEDRLAESRHSKLGPGSGLIWDK